MIQGNRKLDLRYLIEYFEKYLLEGAALDKELLFDGLGTRRVGQYIGVRLDYLVNILEIVSNPRPNLRQLLHLLNDLLLFQIQDIVPKDYLIRHVLAPEA